MIHQKIGSHIIDISNPDKILFPEDNITKKDLIDYYLNMASLIIPHTKNRPLTMQRYPDGIHGQSFYQKDASSYFPSWIRTIAIEKKHELGITNYVVCNNKATLVYLSNQACITPHMWLSKINKLHYPDQIIFDLDPSTNDFKLICNTALRLKEILANLNLTSYVMTTGSKGLHVRVPITRGSKYFRLLDNTKAREFAEKIALFLVKENPDKLTIEMSKIKRGDRLFIDTLRNSYSATAVVPYAVRAIPGAPIATPIFWQDLNDPQISSQIYNIKNIFDRISKTDNPWEDFFSHQTGGNYIPDLF